MNEFQRLRELRELRQPRMPDRDLWPAIEAALNGAAVTRQPASAGAAPRRHWLAGACLAASLALALGMGWHLLRAPAGTPGPATPLAWRPADPRLSGAAIELDAARMELELALQQAPGSAALQRLLRRTNDQRAQLQQLADRPS